MNQEILEKYKKAGEIAKRLRKKYSKRIKPGIKLIDIAEDLESDIIKLGGRPAFPVNLSINEIAAHHTPTLDDKTEFKEGDLIKLDLGVYIDGYIVDTAVTIDLGSNRELVTTAEAALQAAIKLLKPGVKIYEIEKEIENTIRKKGLIPVANLTGHRIRRWKLHTGLSIHSVNTNNPRKLIRGEVLAIEPFVTAGDGWVIRLANSLIYKHQKDKPVRMRLARKVLRVVKREYKQLPFAKRWLEKRFPKLGLNLALNRLESIDAIYRYPILKERSNSKVAQAEHTIIVDDEPFVLT